MNFQLDFTFKNIEVFNLLFSILHCNFILIFYLFFDNITLCTNLQNVTISNMSHLVYITLYGETDGVILSRLDCMAPKTTLSSNSKVGSRYDSM
jgi:hypothetical protein